MKNIAEELCENKCFIYAQDKFSMARQRSEA
jgi:hypothetical protein